jgi:hypothetical protein
MIKVIKGLEQVILIHGDGTPMEDRFIIPFDDGDEEIEFDDKDVMRLAKWLINHI